MKGLLITFEGIEGSGKSTQIEKLGQTLKSEGIPLVVTREPGGTPICEKIRNILLDKNHHRMVAKTELFLYLSSRAQHFHEVIIPEMENGKIVISDRLADATLAYQGYGRGENLIRLTELNRYVMNGIEPKITFLLDIDVSIGLSRAGKRGPLNRLDQEKLEFHQRVREGYLQIAKENQHRIQVITGNNSAEAIHKEIMLKLDSLLKTYRPSVKEPGKGKTRN